MELHSPGTRTEGKCLIEISRAGPMVRGAGRKFDDRLDVRHLYADLIGQDTQEFVVLRAIAKAHFNGANLATEWVAFYSTSDRVSEQLVAVANPEQGDFPIDCTREPSRAAFAPIFFFRHQRARARHDDTRKAVWIGERIAFEDTRNF